MRAEQLALVVALAAASACAPHEPHQLIASIEPPQPAPTRAAFDAFPVYLWCEPGYAGPLGPAWLQGFGGVSAEGGVRPEAALGWRIYVGHAATRNVLHLDRAEIAEGHQAWLARRDDALPQRPSDLSDGALRARENERVAARVAAAPLADFVSLGDEVGTVPFGDPVEFARAALPSAGPTVDVALGLLHGADAASFGARRDAEHAELLALLDELVLSARAARPDVRVGLLGNGARTPFGGIAPRELTDRFDVLEPYDVGPARLGVLALAAPEQSVLRTIFTRSPADDAWQLFEHVLRGGDGAIVWSRRDCAADVERTDALQHAIAVVRALREDLPAIGSRPRGVAILFDEDADRLAWLDVARRERLGWPRRLAGYETEHGPAFARRAAWRAALEDAGALPGALAVSELERVDATSRFPVVIASGLDLGDSATAARLALHVSRGGHVVFDDDAEHLLLDAAHTHRAPPGIDAHGLERRADTPRALRLGAQVRALLAECGAEQAPARFETVGRAGLLQAWSRDESGAWLGIAMTADTGGTPQELVARLEAPSGASIQWLRADGSAVAEQLGSRGPLRTRAGWPLLVRVDLVERGVPTQR